MLPNQSKKRVSSEDFKQTFTSHECMLVLLVEIFAQQLIFWHKTCSTTKYDCQMTFERYWKLFQLFQFFFQSGQWTLNLSTFCQITSFIYKFLTPDNVRWSHKLFYWSHYPFKIISELPSTLTFSFNFFSAISVSPMETGLDRLAFARHMHQ